GLAELDRRAGDGEREYVAGADGEPGRDAELRGEADGGECAEHGAVLRNRYDGELADVWAGDECGFDAADYAAGAVQVLGDSCELVESGWIYGGCWLDEGGE